MTARVVLTRGNRSSWLRLRAQGLGGTDVAAILGMSPFATPLTVWLEKTGRGEPTPDSYPMARGRHMEAFLLAEWGRRNGGIVEKPPALLAHPDYPMIRASLDGLGHTRERSVVLDAKTASWRTRGDWWDDTRMCPDHTAVQMLTYLSVTGLDAAVLVADVAGEYVEVEVMRDHEWEAVALPLLARWWAEHVESDGPPPPDWERDSIPDLNRTWVTELGTAVEAPDGAAGAVKAAATLSARISTLKRLNDALRVQVREAMGTAQTLTLDGQPAARLDARGVLRITYTPPEEHTP